MLRGITSSESLLVTTSVKISLTASFSPPLTSSTTEGSAVGGPQQFKVKEVKKVRRWQSHPQERMWLR